MAATRCLGIPRVSEREKAVQRSSAYLLSLSPALSEVVNSNDKFANSFWKKVRTMICWHDGHLLLMGEVCRMFKTLKRAGELELLSDWNTGHLRWVESKMVFSCNMRFLVLPLQERFRQTWISQNPNPSVYCTPPQSPCWEMRKHRQHMTESLHLPPPRIAITLYQAHLQTAVLTHLHKAAGLDVAANGWYHKTRSLYSNQGANDDHVSGGRPWTTNKVTGSGNFHCQDRLRRLKGILPLLRGTVDLAGQSGRHFKDIPLKSGNWDDFGSCLVFVDEKLGVGAGYFSANGPPPILDSRNVQSPKINFLSTS